MGKYFNIGDAWNDLKNSYGAGDTAIAALKLVGKGISNTAVFGVTEAIPAVVKEAAQKNGKMIDEKLKNDESLSSEERENLEKKKRKSNIYVEMTDLKEKVKSIKNKISENENMSKFERDNLESQINTNEQKISELMEEYRCIEVKDRD